MCADSVHPLVTAPHGRPDPDVRTACATLQAISQKFPPQNPFDRLVTVGEEDGTDDIGISGLIPETHAEGH